jgi:hypothetical protein
VDLQGLLLQSRLDSLLKLVVGRPEHKTKLWIISPVSCHMVLELSSCSVLVTNFSMRPLWPCISFSCHVNVAEFQFLIIYMWLFLGPYQFNDGRWQVSCHGPLCNVELPLSSMPVEPAMHTRWLLKI